MNNRRVTTRVCAVEDTVGGVAVGRHRRGKVRGLTEHVVGQGAVVGGRREPGQVVAVVVAALFVVAAVLDTGPGLLDNLVQLNFGAVGFVMSRRARGARAFLIAGGVAYFLLWQFGTVIDPSLVPFHTGNVVVHLSLVASMIGLAVLSGGRTAEPLVTVPETGHRDATAGYVRRRQAPNRPRGRDDRNSAPRTTSALRGGQRVLACRV
jgi:hypothetical protein